MEGWLFGGMAAEKRVSRKRRRGAAGAYYEEDAFTVLLETEYAEEKSFFKRSISLVSGILTGP